MQYLKGHVLTLDGLIEGYVVLEDGKIAEIVEGKCPERPYAEGVIIPPMVNGHTHCADGGLDVPPGLTLEELVAPPNGLKHVYLNKATDKELTDSIRTYSTRSFNNGIGTFLDFREGGVHGCRLLRDTSPDAVILGRPISPKFDQEELDELLDVADGIGIPSISDMDSRYIEKIADCVRDRRKILGIHVSERIREDIDEVLSLDPTFVIHMTEANHSDMLKCAESEVPIVVCSRSNLYFKKKPPIKKMLESGADIVLGTDNAMLCDPDMRKEASVFFELMRSQTKEIHNIWDYCVYNGRRLLYSQKMIGLASGNQADVTVLPYLGRDPEYSMMNDIGAVRRIRSER